MAGAILGGGEWHPESQQTLKRGIKLFLLSTCELFDSRKKMNLPDLAAVYQQAEGTGVCVAAAAV
jgi:hypothetical protein